VRVLEPEQHRGHLGAELGGIIVGVQESLQGLDALGSAEELLMCLDNLVHPRSAEAEILGDESGRVGCEHAIRQLQVEQPVPDPRRNRAGAVDQEPAVGCLVQKPVLDSELVVGDTDSVNTGQIEVV